MSGASPSPGFPDSRELAHAFFEEGVRHLEDAHVLHEAQRYPASIASAMKAAEFGIKAVIILDGAMGWWDKIFTTHSPMSDINSLPFFRHHVIALGGHSLTLVADIMAMESLAPRSPGKANFDVESAKNPEYPFLSFDRLPGGGAFQLARPSTYFTASHSKDNYNTAQDLLAAVSSQYPAVASWGLTVPARLA